MIAANLKRSMAENISDLLRERILKGELGAGGQLKQDFLAKQYKVSIGAIREALKVLAGEGLVEFTANRGAAVAELAGEEALDIFAIRILLETEALALSAPHLTAEDFVYLDELVRREAECTLPQQYNELNTLFHTTLYKYCNNRYLTGLIELQHNIVGRYLVFYLDKMQFKEQSNLEHQKILAACREGDLTLAKKLLKQHMQQAGKKLADFLNNR